MPLLVKIAALALLLAGAAFAYSALRTEPEGGRDAATLVPREQTAVQTAVLPIAETGNPAQAVAPVKATSTPNTPPKTLTKRPSGIFCLLNGDTVQNPIQPAKLSTLSSWTDPNVDGIAVRSWWNRIEAEEGKLRFEYLDESIRLAGIYKKQISLSVMAGMNTPDWVYASGARKFTFAAPSLQSSGTATAQAMPFPWDEQFLRSWGSFVQAMGDRYDRADSVSYVYVNGLGAASETYFVKSASDMQAFNAAGGIDSWISGAKKIIDLYAAAFPQTPVVIALAPPVAGSDGEKAMRAIVDYGTKTYPGHFGITNHGLSARSSNAFLPNSLIQSHASDSPVGFQMVWSTTGANASQVGGTLAEALERARGLKGQFVEVYLSDCTNRAYADTLKSYSSLLRDNI